MKERRLLFIACDRDGEWPKCETRTAGFVLEDGQLDVRIVRYYLDGQLVDYAGPPPRSATRATAKVAQQD